MSTPFEMVKAMYAREFDRHGDSSAALLTPKGRQELRFRAADPYLRDKDVRVLDYGCGLGYFQQYITSQKFEVNYTGVDILPAFIDTCRKKFPGGRSHFEIIDPTSPPAGEYDVVFASGVFNIKLDGDEATSRAYTFQRLRELFSLTRRVLICDFLSSLVDFRQHDSMHFSLDEIAGFCARDLSRRFIIRHDLLPYEFTLVVNRDGTIKRPENIFSVDHPGGIEPA